jgi:hypothetical protein
MLIPAALAAAFLAIVVHETGHLVGAWLGGLRVDAVQFLGMGWERTANGWRFRLSSAFLDSFVQPSAPDIERGRKGVVAVILGGPLASALLTAGAVLGAVAIPGLASISLAWMSAAVLASCLLPSIRRGFVSDGLRLWRLWRDEGELDQAARGLVTNWFTASPDRPREWDMEVLADLVLDTGCSGVAAADQRVRELQLAYFAFLDRGRFVYAGLVCAAMLDAAERASVSVRRSALFEAAWFKAIHGQDLGGARQAINAALTLSGEGDDQWLGLRARAAVWRETGRRERSAELALEALGQAPADSPINRFRRETLEWLARRPHAMAARA